MGVEKYDYHKATDFGPICHQLDMASGAFFGQEDCLYLNVFRPAGATAGSKLPVFVWIYGGAFTFGDGHQWGFYDGTNVAEWHGHMVVTLNYRLFALGFLALPEIAAENNGTAGNQGLQDQTAALQWVQRNIGAFGGDPDQVTIAGESAGAMSVGAHIVSPGSKGLFRSAIMESGDLRDDYYWYPKLSEAYSVGDDLAAHLPDAPMKLLQRGEFNKVPLIIGTNRDGGSYIGVGTPLAYGAFPLLENDLNKMANWLFENETDQSQFMKLYDEPGGFWRKRMNFGRVFRDSFFQCSSRDIATEVSRHNVPVDHYVFDFKDFGPLDKWFHIGASHIFEIPFVFRTHITALADVFSPWNAANWWKMADMTSCTWASFVKCQKPKCPENPPLNCEEAYRLMPDWTPFSEPDNRNYLRLDLKPTMKKILSSAPIDNEFAGDNKCDFWANVHLKWHDPHDFWKPKKQASSTIVV